MKGVVFLWAVFVGALLYSCITDVRTRRIPNRLVLVLMAVGLVYSGATHLPGPGGLFRAMVSLLLGFVIWFPFYLLRMLGAGDVKLFAAAATWLAPAAVSQAALASALIGGALALFWLVRTQGAWLALTRFAHVAQQPKILSEPLPVSSTHRRVPYGVAMAAGLLLTAWRDHSWL